MQTVFDMPAVWLHAMRAGVLEMPAVIVIIFCMSCWMHAISKPLGSIAGRIQERRGRINYMICGI
jgi:hypothetical protein